MKQPMSDEVFLKNVLGKHYDEAMKHADLIFRVKHGIEETPSPYVFYCRPENVFYCRLAKGYKRGDSRILRMIRILRRLKSSGNIKKEERLELDYLETIVHLLRSKK